MNEELRKLIEWITRNTEAEPMSGMMPGGPYWNVSTYPLLDMISQIFLIPRAEIEAEVQRIGEMLAVELEVEQEHQALQDAEEAKQAKTPEEAAYTPKRYAR